MFLADASTGIPWLDTLVEAVHNFVGPVLIVAAAAGIIYSVVVGVKFVKADNKEQREEAKKKLISVIIGIVVTIILVGLFYWLEWAIINEKINFSSLING